MAEAEGSGREWLFPNMGTPMDMQNNMCGRLFGKIVSDQDDCSYTCGAGLANGMLDTSP